MTFTFTASPGTTTPSSASASTRTSSASSAAFWNSTSFCRSRKSISYFAASSIDIARSSRRSTRTAYSPSRIGFSAASSVDVSKRRSAVSAAVAITLRPSVRSRGGRGPANDARLASVLSTPSKSDVSSFCIWACRVVSSS